MRNTRNTRNVFRNSPQPNPTDPPGGEQPAVNAGSDTFPVDVVAAWTEDRHALTVAVLNSTDEEHPLKLNLSGAPLSGKGMQWRFASAADNGRNPSINHSPVDSIPDSLNPPALQREHLRTFGKIGSNRATD